MAQSNLSARIARATAVACAHAVSRPADNRAAAANAAKSAAAWARWRATTAEPRYAPPPVTDNSTATIAAATTVAEPHSRPGLRRRDTGGRNRQRGQQIRPGGDRRDDKLAVPMHLHHCTGRRNAVGDVEGRALITTRCQPGRLAGGVDTTDLHRHRRNAGQAQHQHRNQRGDAQRRLDGARTGIAD
jgi:hypothetical protein